jgi:hypothetical protein
MNEESPTSPADETAPIAGSQEPSGNRWETPDPAAAEAEVTAEEAAPPAADRSPLTRARAGIAGVAAAALVAVGLGGFAIGRATADGGEPGIQRVGFQQDGDFDGDGRGFGERGGDLDGHVDGDGDHAFPPGPPNGGFPGQAPDDSADGSAGDSADGSET